MNARRAAAIAAREWRSQVSSPLFWGLLVLVGFAALAVNPAAMIPSGDASVAGVRPFSNSRYALAQAFALTGLLFYTFPVALLAGAAVINDDDARIGDLLHSTPLTPAEYVLGKFASVLAACGVVVLSHVAFAMAWYQLGPLVGGDAILGPFALTNYLIPAAVFLAPGAILVAAIAFAIGERTRSVMVVYAVPAALFVVTLTALIPRPASPIDAVLDPLHATFDLWGARWLSHEVFRADRGIAFYNTARLAVDLSFLANRLFVLGLSAVLLWSSVRHCGRVVRGLTEPGLARRPWSRVWQSTRRADPDTPPPPAFAPLRDLAMTMRPAGVVGASWEIARAELRLLRTQPGLYLFAVFAMLLVLEHAGAARGVFDSRVILTAGGLAVGLIEVVTWMGCLLLLFHVVEAMDRPRRLRLDGLLLTTPVPSSAFLAGVLIAGAAVLAVLLAGCLVVAMVMLAVQGIAPVEAAPFLAVWGVVLAPTFAVWALGVAAVQATTRNRHATYLIAFAVLIASLAASLTGSMTWLWNWPLWGALRWSDMGAFELDRQALLGNRLVMLAVAVGFGALAVVRFERTARDVAVSRMARTATAMRRRLVVGSALALLILAPACVLSTQIDRGAEGRRAERRALDYWRRNVATWRGVTPPVVTHLEVHVDLEPRDRRMRAVGSFVMRNDTAVPMPRLAFTVGDAFETVSWTIDGDRVDADDRSGLHVLSLASPLAPGASTRVGFAYAASVPRGVTRNGGGASEFILPSSVVLHTLDTNFLPVPGLVKGLGEGPANRADAPEPSREAWRGVLGPIVGSAVPFTTRVEVSAPNEYTVTSVGEKVSERRESGRTTVVWASAHPVRYLNVVAGRWAVKHRDGAAVYFHPAHGYNVEEILTALAAARRHYSTWFHPYPWKELRINEYADHSTRAQGFPTNIPFSEGIGFLTRSEGAVGLPTIVTAHEAAHQWWANILTPGDAPGADVLLEGMANFSTLLFLEAAHGEAARQRFATWLEERYADQRRVDGERPLLDVVTGRRAADESVASDKGALVMWMLQQRLGRESMLAGIRAFITRFGTGPDHAALPDFLAAMRLYASSPADFDDFVSQWFDSVVVPEFEVRDVRVAATGRMWTVSAVVENVGTGTVPVEVAAVRGERGAADAQAADAAYRDARTRVTLAPGRPMRLEWTAAFAPDSVVVDPDAHVLQAHRDRAVGRLPRPQ